MTVGHAVDAAIVKLPGAAIEARVERAPWVGHVHGRHILARDLGRGGGQRRVVEPNMQHVARRTCHATFGLG